MAERVMVVCDVCGKSPAETVGITATGKSYRKDLCREHLADLLKGARAPRRGRPASSTPRIAATKTAATPAAPKVVAKRARKPITDPVLLEKRRAALAKARQARADKRAAAKRAG